MDVIHMREFLVLADKLNYTTAAQALYISQPTLTRHINALEEELGARLLDRTRHSVELTPSGEAAVKAFRTIVLQSDELLAQIGKIAQDDVINLRLGMVYYGVSAFYGYPLLKALAVRYPEVRVSTTVSQSIRIYERLYARTIDAGLSISSSHYVDDSVKKTVVATIPLYAVVLPGHPLAQRNSVTVEELSKEKIILNTIPLDQMHHIAELFYRHGFPLEDIEYIEHIDMMLQALGKDEGVFVGSMLLSAIPQQDLVFVPIEADDFTIDVALLHLKGNDNPNIKKLIDCIGDIRIPNL